MRILALLSLVLLGWPPQATTGSAPIDGVSFAFDPRAGVDRPSYVLAVNTQGFGRYTEFARADGPAAAPVTVSVSPATLQVIGEAREFVLHAANGSCETRHKGIAQTGRKTLTFYQGGQSAACTFNYSDEERVNRSAATFEAIAETLQFGDRLEHAHRFDRLGLDAEMEELVAENRAGRAIELQNLARTLQSLVTDDRVLERVRLQAARLLQESGVPLPEGVVGTVSER